MAALVAIVTIAVATVGSVNQDRGTGVASTNAGALTLKDPPPLVKSANPQQVNMPAQASAVEQVASRFKGTHDLAGAAEALIAAAGSQFVHGYGSNADPLRKAFSQIASFDDLYGQRLMVCSEFVHYVAYLASNQLVLPGDTTRAPTPRVGHADSTLYDTSSYAVWDGKGEIPRGKVTIFVSWAWNNMAGYYHVGISLGNGKIAHNSSIGHVQISDLSDVNSIGYSEIRIGSYNWRLAGEPGTPVDAVTRDSASAAPTAPTKPQGPLLELQRALDNAQQGLRFAGPSTCCGDPLGAFYSAPAARPTSQFQFFVTGAPIDLEIPDPTTSPSDNRPPGFTAYLGGSRELEPPGGPRFALATLRRPANEPTATDTTASVPPPAPAIILVATGASTGDTFRLQVVGGPGVTGRLVASDGLILEPLSIKMPELSGVSADTMVRNLPGFSVDPSKTPPPAGTMYRVADARQQDRLKPLRQLVRAADNLAAARGLHPDSDPAEYLNFVKQYAIWTALERWDLRTFGEQFTARTKKRLETLKRPWTRDVEGQIRGLVPGRWADVQAVVNEAGARINSQRRP
jgi:hypothetical protein